MQGQRLHRERLRGVEEAPCHRRGNLLPPRAPARSRHQARVRREGDGRWLRLLRLHRLRVRRPRAAARPADSAAVAAAAEPTASVAAAAESAAAVAAAAEPAAALAAATLAAASLTSTTSSGVVDRTSD